MITTPFQRASVTRRPATGARRGGAYVAVLGVAMLLAVIGAGSIAVARVKSRNADLSTHSAHARQAAVAMVEGGRAIIERDTTWRTSRGQGQWLSTSIGAQGVAKLTVTCPSGEMNASDIEPVLLVGESSLGGAHQRVSARVEFLSRPMTSLGVGMAAGGLVTLTTATLKSASQTVSSNTGFTSLLSDVDVRVQSSGTIVGTGYKRTTTTGLPTREIPGPEACDWYIANGSTLSSSSLNPSLLNWNLSGLLLSPQHNPYGDVNPKGIYVLDCAGRTVLVSDIRVVGTLVLLNPGLGTAVEGSVSFEQAIPGFPVLMVRGNLELRAGNTNLAENTSKTNLNPPGTPYPYPSGATNGGLGDSYPSGLHGLVFVSGSVTLGGDTTVRNLIVGGAVTITSGKTTFFYDSNYHMAAPPGFRVTSSALLPGSWQRITR